MCGTLTPWQNTPLYIQTDTFSCFEGYSFTFDSFFFLFLNLALNLKFFFFKIFFRFGSRIDELNGRNARRPTMSSGLVVLTTEVVLEVGWCRHLVPVMPEIQPERHRSLAAATSGLQDKQPSIHCVLPLRFSSAPIPAVGEWLPVKK